jgi:hypothetical protein
LESWSYTKLTKLALREDEPYFKATLKSRSFTGGVLIARARPAHLNGLCCHALNELTPTDTVALLGVHEPSTGVLNSG